MCFVKSKQMPLQQQPPEIIIILVNDVMSSAPRYSLYRTGDDGISFLDIITDHSITLPAPKSSHMSSLYPLPILYPHHLHHPNIDTLMP